MRYPGIDREWVLKKITDKLSNAKKNMAKKNNETVCSPASPEAKKLQIGSITIRKNDSN